MSRDGSEEEVYYPDHLLTDAGYAAATATPPRGELAVDEDDDNAYVRIRPSQSPPQQSPEKKLKTLRELAEGPNREAALNEIEDITYTLATLANLIALRLCNSSGGRSPYTFSTETRSYVEKNPRINVQLPGGRRPPFVRPADNEHTEITNDMDV